MTDMIFIAVSTLSSAALVLGYHKSKNKIKEIQDIGDRKTTEIKTQLLETESERDRLLKKASTLESKLSEKQALLDSELSSLQFRIESLEHNETILGEETLYLKSQLIEFEEEKSKVEKLESMISEFSGSKGGSANDTLVGLTVKKTKGSAVFHKVTCQHTSQFSTEVTISKSDLRVLRPCKQCFGLNPILPVI